MAKYMIIGEEEDGFQFYVCCPTKKSAEKAAKKMIREAESEYCYALEELFIVKTKYLNIRHQNNRRISYV